MNIQQLSAGMSATVRSAPQQDGASVQRQSELATGTVTPPFLPEASPPSAPEVEEAVSKVSEFVSRTSNQINISIDKESGMRVVKVVDAATNEVVRQIPSEEIVAIARALDKLQGLFLRDKV